jgi:signal transduction histidine kinase/CheY-like chemotaxis protein
MGDDTRPEALAHAGLLSSLQRSSERLRALVEVTRSFAETADDYLRLLRVIVEQTSKLMDGLCILGVVTEDGLEWEKVSEFASDPSLLEDRVQAFGQRRLPLAGPTIIGHVARTGEALRIDDLATSPWMQTLPPVLIGHIRKYNMRGMVTVPMRSKGRVLGVLSITRFGLEPAAVEQGDHDLLQVLADHAAQTIVSARHLAAVQRELEEHKRTRAALAASEEKLRQAAKMEAVGLLAGGVAHDFNNILFVILGYTELLLSEAAEQQPLKGRLEEVRRAGERARELTHQLLAFGRTQVLAPRVLDLNKALRSMTPLLQRLLGEDVELHFLAAANPWLCHVDPGQMEQIVMNLAVNARDAMPGGGAITIATANVMLDPDFVAAHPEASPGPHVMLSVRDTGLGMPPEVLSRIFEPFFTTKPKGVGTGLGLATVYGIVKQSGGSLRVESSAGYGTTFIVYLPRVDGVETLESLRPARSAASEGLRGRETVLLVEDEEQVRGLVRNVLADAGYRVLEAKGGSDAISLCLEHAQDIDLLLTDVVMPRLNGRELADELIQLRSGLKVLYMSGYTEDAILHRGVLEAGVQFLSKPVTPDALLRKVREVLG